MSVTQTETIAVIHNGFSAKFGVPRQSGLDTSTVSTIVMEEKYRVPEAFRGIEEFSHLWILWLFDADKSGTEDWSPTVRPPKLGGNRRVGVFASRSPNRPNHIGMTVVRLISAEIDPLLGPVLRVTGADMTDGTRIIDIKPYIPYADSVPGASGGYAVTGERRISVISSSGADLALPEDVREAARELVSLDPRPGYQSSPDRVYYMDYSGWEIGFTVDRDTADIRFVRRKS